MNPLETILRSYLNKGKDITVEWDCGGDEALLYIFINKKKLPYDHEMDPLAEYLIEHLELPTYGEYFVEGGGTIFLEKDKVKIKHSSHAHGSDYTDEGEEIEVDKQIGGTDYVF